MNMICLSSSIGSNTGLCICDVSSRASELAGAIGKLSAYALHAPRPRLGVSTSAYCRVQMVADIGSGGLHVRAVTRSSSSLLSRAH